MKSQKPRRWLFLFRIVDSDKTGVVRATNVEEAVKIVMEHVGQPVEIYRTPNCFTLYIPPWL